MQVKVQTKGAAKSVNVSDVLFQTEVSEHLLAQAVRTQLANRRLAPAHTKDRGDVSGGGRKPWRQKGTGRARVGSIRNPIWRGGGVVFGPTGEINHSLKMPQGMRRRALLGALSTQWAAGKVTVVPDFSLQKPSTKQFVQQLAEQEIPASRTTMVIGQPDETLFRSSDNIPEFTLVTADYLSTYQILTSQRIIFTESGLAKCNELYGGAK